MSRAKKALNPDPDPQHWNPGSWIRNTGDTILMNLLGDHILVAKAPGHHGDEQGEEGTESRIRIRTTGIPDPRSGIRNTGEEGTESRIRIRYTGIPDPGFGIRNSGNTS